MYGRESFSDVCVECILSSQFNAMSPSCTEMDNFTISECVDGNCYGGGSLCQDFAMDLFDCVVDEDCPNLPTFHEERIRESRDAPHYANEHTQRKHST